ncbi:MAG: LytTR family DNA-binding domain-containing protein [Breznakibacter sp.]
MKILIVEDEAQAALTLGDIIKEANPPAQIVQVTESIAQTVDFLKWPQNRPDLIFMDIQLADGLSFEIFKQTNIQCPVIFCTAYDHYTLEAFRTNGIAYILKPVKEDDIKAAFAKTDMMRQAFTPKANHMDALQSLLTGKKQYKSTILVRFRESYIPVPVQSVAFFFLEDGVVNAYRTDGQYHAVFKPLDELEQWLDPDLFFRVTRQCILNRAAIVEVQPYFNRKMVVKTSVAAPDKITVSRLKVPDFLNWIEQGHV